MKKWRLRRRIQPPTFYAGEPNNPQSYGGEPYSGSSNVVVNYDNNSRIDAYVENNQMERSGTLAQNQVQVYVILGGSLQNKEEVIVGNPELQGNITRS